MSEANRQAESQDPYQRDTTRANEGNFRIAIRFFDDHEAELPSSNREAAAGESPARQCRVSVMYGTSRVGTAPSHESSRIAK
jgi:hypothetical protein